MEWQARRVCGAAGAWQAKVMPSFENPMRFLEEVEPEPAPLAEMQAWCGAALGGVPRPGRWCSRARGPRRIEAGVSLRLSYERLPGAVET